MNPLKTHTIVQPAHAERAMRARFNPIRALTADSLTRMLDAFQHGELAQAALLWDAIERRDDVLQGVASKRKKSIAQLDWEIIALDDSREAQAHRQALEDFYNHISATHALDMNQRGGLSLLIKQMMDAVGKRYAVHEIVWQPQAHKHAGSARGSLRAQLRFVPLWFFENRTGRLRFVEQPGAREGIDLSEDGWMVTTSDGIMESCSIAYLFKHLPLRDWLIYCERNGMPGVKGITDAAPGSAEWESARDAVRDFGAEFHALMTRTTDIQAIDLSCRGELPYPALVERMDRAMAALWRGADLGTFSRDEGARGASVQGAETTMLEADDASLISETLNTQLGRPVIRHLFGTETPRAYLRLITRDRRRLDDLLVFEKLHAMGVPLSHDQLAERFGIRLSAQHA